MHNYRFFILLVVFLNTSCTQDLAKVSLKGENYYGKGHDTTQEGQNNNKQNNNGIFGGVKIRNLEINK